MSKHKIAVMSLNDAKVSEIIRELEKKYGTATPVMLNNYFTENGVYNQRTGRPFSRQAIYLFMHQYPTSLVSRTYRGVRPLLVTSKYYPNVSTWLQNILVNPDVVEDASLQPIDCVSRDLYGFPTLPCLLMARSIYTILADGVPLILDVINPDITYTFKRMACRLI